MATRKTPARTSRTSRTAAARRTTRRRTTSTARSRRRRTSSGALYPRRRRARPGLPTTLGAALGTLAVTTLLDLSWPARIGLLALVLVVGLAYVLWRHRAEIAAAGAQPDDAAAGDGAPPADSAFPPAPPPPSAPPPAPPAS